MIKGHHAASQKTSEPRVTGSSPVGRAMKSRTCEVSLLPTILLIAICIPLMIYGGGKYSVDG